MINRFSSLRQRLDESFLNVRLRDAISYDRIAGYFRSSVLEVAGEAIESVKGPIRIICNSDLSVDDVATAKLAQMAMRREWGEYEPEKKLTEPAQPRLKKLYQLLKSGRLQIKVIPRDKFGLVHGKAGVITLADGQKTAFMGSANETALAWRMHYELVWEDDSEDAVCWVQEEFDALWSSAYAVPLADFVIEDIGRLSDRTVVPTVQVWRENPDPASVAVEAPVFRKENGLWAHQKYFVHLAFEAHRRPSGARFVLADQVGLGKTVQLALTAQLMALYGDKPVLILAPKTLLRQWQEEMITLLDMPSAIWTGRSWLDENEIEHPVTGPEGIMKCPRRIGLVSQGLVVRDSEVVTYLKQGSWEAVIVDEAHRARRRNIGLHFGYERADPNNLLRFLREVAGKTQSLILATATPVQTHPIEAWDMLDTLSVNNDSVLGNKFSRWRNPEQALKLVMGESNLPNEELERWNWIRNPFPSPESEDRDVQNLRRSWRVDEDPVIPFDVWESMSDPERQRVKRLAQTFVTKHNPFLRHIVLRTRKFLEETIDPSTGEGYLKKVEVELLGEKDNEAIPMPLYVKDAYTYAKAFCDLLNKRIKGGGFLKTQLLRRVGSTVHAGRLTGMNMLDGWKTISDEDDDDDESPFLPDSKTLTAAEREQLQSFVDALNANQEPDPKYQVVLDILLKQNWLEAGCIIFSQYFDSVWWLAENLTRDMPEERIGIYAGSTKSGIMIGSQFSKVARDDLKKMVARGEIRLLLGTDAASEGLNLQRLGNLINLDLPWNPTKLQQRKGRIQRIGQVQDKVHIYNMRYKGSVEDRVHELLSDRLEEIYNLFGQIPDVLEDVWVEVALGDIQRAKQTIDAVPRQNPFELKYHQFRNIPWESCVKVLDVADRRQHLLKGW